MPINFKDLINLADECEMENPFVYTIATLAMADIPMSDAVIKIGVALDILLPDYESGWSRREAN